MPFTNYEARHFTPSESKTIDQLLKDLEAALQAKLANLTPEERQRMGSVNEQNKLIINKVKDYRDAQPELSSPDVDWPEYDRDYYSRSEIGSVMQRLMSLHTGLNNAKILHDWDNYQAALTDYQYSQYKNGTSATGFETKVRDISQFFSNSRTGSSSAADPEPGSENES